MRSTKRFDHLAAGIVAVKKWSKAGVSSRLLREVKGLLGKRVWAKVQQ